MDCTTYVWILLVVTTNLSKLCSTAETSEVEGNDDDDLEHQIMALDSYIYSQMVIKFPNTTTPPPPDVPNMSIFTQLYETAAERVKSGVICTACKAGIGLLMYKVRVGNFSVSDIQRVAVFGCQLFQIATPEVCNGLIERYGPVFRYLFLKLPNMLPGTFCGVMLQSYGCTTNAPELEWTVDIPPEKRGRYINSATSDRFQKTKAAQKVKIIQMSDIHIDLLYEPESNAVCDNKILCCQGSQGRPLDKTLQAGTFGDDRKCDPPYSTLELALKHISLENADAKFFYYTGDIVPHNIWSTTQADNTKVIHAVAKLVLKYFPNMKIIPVLGNHEPHPVNFYSPRSGIPPEFSTTWIYNVTFEVYKQWIPEDQHDLYLTYGYYAVEIDNTFKILVLNTNFCYEFNVWQLYEPGDTGGQLKWLIGQLQEAENRGQTVHIVGHVPPGYDECFRVFSRNFYNIILRYHQTVRGQFYGHTHYDEFKVYYDANNTPVNTLWISPSLTPYETNNVAYRVYYADDMTYNIDDHETWIFDLDLANRNGENGDIEWFKLYSSSVAYGLSNVAPESMSDLVEKMARDSGVFQKFYKHYFKATDTNGTVPPCNTHCRKRMLCGIVKSYSGETENCARVQYQVDGIVLPISLL